MINSGGMLTLLQKELRRFLKVSIQTILTPMVTALLYLLIFSSVLSGRLEVYEGIDYVAFLIPGLVVMAMLQNAFANSSSSLFQSKMNGNIVFMLLAPLSNLEIYAAYVTACAVRGLLVGAGVWITSFYFSTTSIHNIGFVLAFGVLGCGILGGLGLLGAVCAEKWDHIAAFQNFVILPLSFLSGVFFSIHTLPPLWEKVSYYNPFFYIVDGFRYGFLGVSDTNPIRSLGITAVFFVVISIAGLVILKSGYKLRE